jgi:hypothetical protein
MQSDKAGDRLTKIHKTREGGSLVPIAFSHLQWPLFDCPVGPGISETIGTPRYTSYPTITKKRKGKSREGPRKNKWIQS